MILTGSRIRAEHRSDWTIRDFADLVPDRSLVGGFVALVDGGRVLRLFDLDAGLPARHVVLLVEGARGECSGDMWFDATGDCTRECRRMAGSARIDWKANAAALMAS